MKKIFKFILYNLTFMAKGKIKCRRRAKLPIEYC